MIKIKNLTHRYDNRKENALFNISLEIQAGENVVLLGSSGSGKSTLIRCINRLIEPTAGCILIAGQDILRSTRRNTKEIRRKIGVIFQEFNLVERDSVLKNVLNGRLGYVGVWRTLFNKFKKKDYEVADKSLKRVGLFDLKWERVCNLSGGQKQRVAIARALSQEPEIILADEPVSSLDPKLMKEVMDLLQKICREERITLVTSLHFVELVKEYATRVIGISNGNMVFDSNLADINEENLVGIYGETTSWFLPGFRLKNEYFTNEKI